MTTTTSGLFPKEQTWGLGFGNPVALAAVREGDIALDLGSGAGFDAFPAAARSWGSI